MSAPADPQKAVAAQLVEAFVAWERALGTPLVPGELVAWLQSVEQAARQAGPLLETWINREHPRLLEEILQQDVELATRVDKMRGDAATILERFAALEQDIDKLAAVAGAAQPREDKLETQRQALVQSGIDLIVVTRKQQAALDTWHGEAFHRDRGGAG